MPNQFYETFNGKARKYHFEISFKTKGPICYVWERTSLGLGHLQRPLPGAMARGLRQYPRGLPHIIGRLHALQPFEKHLVQREGKRRREEGKSGEGPRHHHKSMQTLHIKKCVL